MNGEDVGAFLVVAREGANTVGGEELGGVVEVGEERLDALEVGDGEEVEPTLGRTLEEGDLLGEITTMAKKPEDEMRGRKGGGNASHSVRLANPGSARMTGSEITPDAKRGVRPTRERT